MLSFQSAVSIPVADEILSTLDRFLHIEALGGIVLLTAIFVAGLAFRDAQLLGAAKLGVGVAPGLAGLIALCMAPLLLRRRAVDKAP